MRLLFLDCFSGISGDMTVGALTDLGVKPSTFEWELSKLDIGDFHMHFENGSSRHIAGIKFGIHEGATHKHEEKKHHGEPHTHEGHSHHEQEHCHEHGHECKHGHKHEHQGECGHDREHHRHECKGDHEDEHHHGHECCHGHEQADGHAHECKCGHDHGHHHEHEEHEHGRSYADIKALIEKSGLSDFVKKHALSIFHRIAVAEGKIHGMPPNKVEFHEVGALDSIADIVLACVGIEALGVEKIYVSNLSEGTGWIHCAHGKFPIPAPATLELLKGIPIRQIDEPFEFITPTGAAILAEFGVEFGPMPAMSIEKIGYGLGTRTLPDRPNVLRAVLGKAAKAVDGGASGYETDTITRMETNIDDLPPELTGAVMDRLLAAGALDVYFTPIQMKKNRPAVQLGVLCESADVTKIADLIFSETTAFGLRMDEVRRLKLDRKFEKVKTPFGVIDVKLGLKNGVVIQVAPEFESVRAAGEKTGQPLRVIFEAAKHGVKTKGA